MALLLQEMVAMIAWDIVQNLVPIQSSAALFPWLFIFLWFRLDIYCYHYYFWVMHLQCSSLQCHLEVHYTLYRVHNVCTLLFYSQMHFFNLLIDLTNNLIFIGDIKLVFPFYLYSSFFYRGMKLEIVQGWNLWHFNIAWTSCWLMAFWSPHSFQTDIPL